MTFPLRLLMILFAIGGTLRGADAGGESELPETGWTTEFSDRLHAVFEESAATEHAGLLGRFYVQSRVTLSNVPNKDLRGYDRSAEISEGLFNIPLWTFDFPKPLKVDIFHSYSVARVEGYQGYTGNYQSDTSFSHNRDRVELGVTLFTEWNDRFRPFLQVGVRYDETEEVISKDLGYSTWGISPIWIDDRPFYFDNRSWRFAIQRDRESSAIVRPGFEFDLLDNLSYRMTIDINSSIWTKRSEFRNDLVYWPFRKFFVRGGVNNTFDGTCQGFSLGMGLVY